MKFLPILLSVSLTGFSQILFKIGMRDFHFTNVHDFVWFLVRTPWILLGLLLMGLGVLIWFFVLSKNDVSYAYPFVSVAFIIVLIGGYCMGESWSVSRMIGFCFLIVGMFFIAR